MKTVLLVLLLNSILFDAMSQTLTRQVFEVGDRKEDCQVEAQCDCCSSEILILDENKFAMITPCTYESDLYVGNYKIKANTVTLTFKSTAFAWGVNEKDGKEFAKKKQASNKPLTFEITTCEDGKTLLQRSDINDIKIFGLSRKGLNADARIKDFYNSREWKLLNK